MAFVYIIAGFLLLLFCAELLVKGSVAMAERLGVSALVIGLTVVAFGTSAPELIVSLNAALTGAPSLAVGNVVGSNIANILMILGLTGLILPIPCADTKQFIRDGGTNLAVAIGFAVIVFTGVMTRWEGVIMVLALVAFLYYSYTRESKESGVPEHAQEVAEHEQFKNKSWLIILSVTLAGLLGVLWGADLLVKGAVTLARAVGVTEEVIGLTVVAFGTSLPELATSMAAAWRRQPELALGNVVGSCIFNILGIMGITAMVIPIPIPAQVASFDIWVMIGASVLLIPFVISYKRVTRSEAAIFLVAYVAYIAIQYFGVETVLGKFQ